MEEEEKGFVIKDRRSFDDKGELKEEGAKQEPPQKEEKVEKKKPEPERGPLPEVNFNSLIFKKLSQVLYRIEAQVPVSTQFYSNIFYLLYRVDHICW